MADVSIQEYEATQWISDVEREISEVKALLKEVAEINQSIPGDDDTIMQGIISACETLNNTWNNTVKTFNDAVGKVRSAIENTIKTGKKVVESAATFKASIH